MFKLSKQSGLNWAQSNNVFIPRAITSGCFYCKRNPVTFSLAGSWNSRDDSMFNKTTCPACGKEISVWLLLRTKQETASNAPNVTDIYIEPDPPLAITYDSCIDDVSKNFAEIYRQAVCAEANGLDSLVGIGYRKALEFLIKDWLIKEQPDKADDIKKSLLGKCVSDYIQDISLKTCLSRTVWLGNDETHYVRTWPEKDISDLKMLLEISLRKIAGEIMIQKMPETMPKK